MSKDNTIKPFNSEDIERYHQGLMSATERNALEKAALEDPFLADALEGFTNTPVDLATDMKELKERLGKRTEKKNKVIPIAPKKGYNYFIRVAAMILLMAGAGWFFYQFSRNKEPEAPIALNDSNRSVADTTAVAKSPAASPVENNVQFLNTDTVKRSDKNKNETVLSEQKQVKAADNKSYYWGTAISDTSSIPHSDSDKETMARDRTKSAENLAGSEKTMPSSPSGLYADSIVVSGMGVKKSIARSAKEIADKTEPIAVPLVGWPAYQQYLKDSLRAIPNYKDVNGQFVELTFDINENGKPHNYTIISSFSKSAAEEAWRLVSQGSLWTPGKAKLKIYF